MRRTTCTRASARATIRVVACGRPRRRGSSPWSDSFSLWLGRDWYDRCTSSWRWRQQSRPGPRRDTPLAQVVGTGPMAERCVDGANATLVGHMSTAVQETVSTRNLMTWWLPTRCSPAYFKEIVLAVPLASLLLGVATPSLATFEISGTRAKLFVKPPIKVHRRKRPCANTARSLRQRRKLWRTFKPERRG